MSSKIKLYLLLIFTHILFGINYSTNKVVLNVIDPFVWTTIRFLLAGVVLLTITLSLKRKHPSPDKEFLLPLFIFSIIGGATALSLFLYGLSQTTSVNGSIIFCMLPILTLTISVVRRVEKATIGKILGLILSIIGIAFTVNLNHFSISQSSLKGDFILLLGTTFWSAYYSFGKEFLQKYDNLWITTWMFFISGIVLLVLNLNKFMNFIIPEMTPELVGSILFTILGATGLAYYLTNTTLKKLPATISALAVYIQPVVAGIIGVIFLKESITLNTVIGDLLIIAGVLVAAFYKPKAVSTPVQN